MQHTLASLNKVNRCNVLDTREELLTPTSLRLSKHRLACRLSAPAQPDSRWASSTATYLLSQNNCGNKTLPVWHQLNNSTLSTMGTSLPRAATFRERLVPSYFSPLCLQPQFCFPIALLLPVFSYLFVFPHFLASLCSVGSIEGFGIHFFLFPGLSPLLPCLHSLYFSCYVILALPSPALPASPLPSSSPSPSSHTHKPVTCLHEIPTRTAFSHRTPSAQPTSPYLETTGPAKRRTRTLRKQHVISSSPAVQVLYAVTSPSPLPALLAPHIYTWWQEGRWALGHPSLGQHLFYICWNSSDGNIKVLSLTLLGLSVMAFHGWKQAHSGYSQHFDAPCSPRLSFTNIQTDACLNEWLISRKKCTCVLVCGRVFRLIYSCADSFILFAVSENELASICTED